jgi:hypothetical protein
MSSKSKRILHPLPLDTKNSTITVNNDKDFVFNKVLFDIDALIALESTLNTSDSVDHKTASLKFMITMQDETDLLNLGYSKEQIDKLKPQEAADIIKSGMKAEPPNGQE